ncbi:MAG: hypothetical protein KGH61_02385 [Candidatus Micrarchaeota archaeon]|nr:hypothetical protein [Candidatus Micrarchaeota archaeon]MDE1847776.1 hypothetical protein [Candidatus Micrarchaeota archaeon]MDE1864214.1 hypothetical protein [Candidatus Micrarchaeota archaeon]
MDNVAATSRMVRTYIATGFLYFVVGTILLAFNLSGAVTVSRDPIFILLLYGFVTQLIFGVSYIFVPGVSRHSGVNYKVIIIEYVLLNAGIIAFDGVALTGQQDAAVILGGLIVMIVAVLLHAVNIWHTIIDRKSRNTT